MSHGCLGFDYTAGPGHAPGVGRYVRELVRALVRLPLGQGPPVRPLRLVEFGRAPRPMDGAPLGLSGPEVARPWHRVRLGLPRRVLAAADRWAGLTGSIAGRGCEIFHRVPSERNFRLRVPVSLAVAEFPRLGSQADESLGLECLNARGVMVFSADAAGRIVSRYGVDPVRVHQVPVGSEHWERDLPQSVEPRPSTDILVLGAVRSSRLPLDVLAAFEALAAVDGKVRLLIVGRPGDASEPFTSALDRSPVRARVRWIQAPSEGRMPSCVAGASALLHLTEDEASPVTPLEAVRMGLPVVASRIPAFEEALGRGARFVEPGDHDGTAQALQGAIEDARSSAARLALREIAEPFTWQASAKAHLAAWQTMISSPPPPSAG